MAVLIRLLSDGVTVRFVGSARANGTTRFDGDRAATFPSRYDRPNMCGGRVAIHYHAPSFKAVSYRSRSDRVLVRFPCILRGARKSHIYVC